MARFAEDWSTMRRAAKAGLGLAAAGVVIVAFFFLVPVFAITVVFVCPAGDRECPVSVVPISASASVMYAKFGVGAVYVPNDSGGHNYCFISVNNGMMCGTDFQRIRMG
jgi:hypothetical protein